MTDTAKRLELTIVNPRIGLRGKYGRTHPGVYWRIAEAVVAVDPNYLVVTLEPVDAHEPVLSGVKDNDIVSLVGM